MRDEKPENPPAFPQHFPNLGVSAYGMTLRDYFAGQALTALIQLLPKVKNEQNEQLSNKDVSIMSFSLADEMLKARALCE